LVFNCYNKLDSPFVKVETEKESWTEPVHFPWHRKNLIQANALFLYVFFPYYYIGICFYGFTLQNYKKTPLFSGFQLKKQES